jgi:hypothetical protein
MPGRALLPGTHVSDPYPEALRDLADAELAELIGRFEPVAPASDDCGAQDWSVLEQRVHYIVTLFRAWHENPDLSRPPFTPAQLERIIAGVISRRRPVMAPAGVLGRRDRRGWPPQALWLHRRERSELPDG